MVVLIVVDVVFCGRVVDAGAVSFVDLVVRVEELGVGLALRGYLELAVLVLLDITIEPEYTVVVGPTLAAAVMGWSSPLLLL